MNGMMKRRESEKRQNQAKPAEFRKRNCIIDNLTESHGNNTTINQTADASFKEQSSSSHGPKIWSEKPNPSWESPWLTFRFRSRVKNKQLDAFEFREITQESSAALVLGINPDCR
jgi:hypothetical protein